MWLTAAFLKSAATVILVPINRVWKEKGAVVRGIMDVSVEVQATLHMLFNQQGMEYFFFLVLLTFVEFQVELGHLCMLNHSIFHFFPDNVRTLGCLPGIWCKHCQSVSEIYASCV